MDLYSPKTIEQVDMALEKGGNLVVGMFPKIEGLLRHLRNGIKLGIFRLVKDKGKAQVEIDPKYRV